MHFLNVTAAAAAVAADLTPQHVRGDRERFFFCDILYYLPRMLGSAWQALQSVVYITSVVM